MSLDHDTKVFYSPEGLSLISFTVHGEPAPQGSKRHVGGGKMVEMLKTTRPWRERVAAEARALGVETILGPVHIEITFYFRHLTSHYGSGRNAHKLKESAPDYKKTAPDIDKLARAVLDALTESAMIRDDGQAAVLICEKRYAMTPGAWVRVRPLS